MRIPGPQIEATAWEYEQQFFIQQASDNNLESLI